MRGKRNVFTTGVVITALLVLTLYTIEQLPTGAPVEVNSDRGGSPSADGRRPIVPFPDEVMLPYKARALGQSVVELEPITHIPDTWALQEGAYSTEGSGRKMTVRFYTEAALPSVHAVLDHEGQLYAIRNMLYHLQDLSIYSLALSYADEDGRYSLVAGMGSPSLGYRYLIFDEKGRKWHSYTNWGTPEVVDVDGDSTMEILFQFQGLHNNPPDITVMRFRQGRFETVEINEALMNRMDVDPVETRLSSRYEIVDGVVYVYSTTTDDEGAGEFRLEGDRLVKRE